jgi:hypothetical protein
MTLAQEVIERLIKAANNRTLTDKTREFLIRAHAKQFAEQISNVSTKNKNKEE